ncbi:conjugal transfer protein TraX [Escherichia coli]|nr:conjugal transfer protein TraX [Escherichia coli]
MTTDNTNTTRNDSLAARTDTWLQSLLVWSPGQRDIIKTVALVLMVLDHANRILHLDQSWMFLVGVTNGAIVIHTQRLKSDPGGNLLS